MDEQYNSLVEEHGNAFKVAYHNFGDIEEAETAVTEHYAGEWNSIECWAEEFLADTGALSEIPENLKCYFDYSAWARDAEMGGDIWSDEDEDGCLHIFWNH